MAADARTLQQCDLPWAARGSVSAAAWAPRLSDNQLSGVSAGPQTDRTAQRTAHHTRQTPAVARGTSSQQPAAGKRSMRASPPRKRSLEWRGPKRAPASWRAGALHAEHALSTDSVACGGSPHRQPVPALDGGGALCVCALHSASRVRDTGAGPSAATARSSSGQHSSGQHSSGRAQGLAASPLGCWLGRSSALGKCKTQQRGAVHQTRETQAPQSTNTARLPVQSYVMSACQHPSARGRQSAREPTIRRSVSVSPQHRRPPYSGTVEAEPSARDSSFHADAHQLEMQRSLLRGLHAFEHPRITEAVCCTRCCHIGAVWLGLHRRLGGCYHLSFRRSGSEWH